MAEPKSEETPLSPAPTPAASATAPSPQETLVSQYELGDTGHVPELDEPLVDKPSGAAPVVPAAETPARGADGRFLPKPEVASHSPHIVLMAKDHGLSDEEIAAASPDALAHTVHHLTRRALQSRQERSSTAPPATPAAPAKPETLEDLGINEADYDAGLMKVIKGMHQRLLAAESRVQTQEQRESARESESLAQRVDNTFAKHEGILGKGRGTEMDKASAEYIRRVSVLRVVHEDPSHDSLEKKIDRAVQVLFGSSPAAPAATPARGKSPSPEEWSRAGLARPTNRDGAAEPKGEKRATKAVAKQMRENGMVLDEFEGTEEDGLLG